MNYKNFEEFLAGQCDCHTNNSPEGFERWLENMDLQEMQDYAEEWGQREYLRGKEEVIGKIEPVGNFMQDLLNGISNPSLSILDVNKKDENS